MGKKSWMFGSKALSKKMKMAGLQKTRWYCQVCQKQCRDAHGFKSHTKSDGHLRMMKIVAQNKGKYISQFSKQFEKAFTDILRIKYKNRRVFANKVYNEYIRDKNHIHLNSTRWSSLTGFIRHLGRTEVAEIEDTPKGWYITYYYVGREEQDAIQGMKDKEEMDIIDESRTKSIIKRKMRALQQAMPVVEEEVEFIDDGSSIEGIKLQPSKRNLRANVFEETPNTTEQSSISSDRTRSPSFHERKKRSNSYEEGYSSERTNSRGRRESRGMSDSRDRRDRSDSRDRRDRRDSRDRRDRSDSRDRRDRRDSRDRRDRRDRRERRNSRDRRYRANSREKYSREKDRDDTNRKRKRLADDDRYAKKRKKDSNLTDIAIQIKKKNETKLRKQEEKRKKLEEELEKMKEIEGRKDYWLCKDIIVKVIDQEVLDGSLYGRKGTVTEVEDFFTATVEMLEGDYTVKFDQDLLETVIPALESRVRIVNGAYRGKIGRIKNIKMDEFKVQVLVDGKLIDKEYEDICKMAEKSAYTVLS
eukprot:TRINITY_DN2020_c0_g1_i4.p1 TRINITY_DN2020_c0_g1~~TRINITY_DN2020_c0_g1_i4.p1  ORF type:complete len:529 (-),score=130.35 TRINITY_DN2020_c0_g1_i4:88-1674(-)